MLAGSQSRLTKQDIKLLQSTLDNLNITTKLTEEIKSFFSLIRSDLAFQQVFVSAINTGKNKVKAKLKMATEVNAWLQKQLTTTKLDEELIANIRNGAKQAKSQAPEIQSNPSLTRPQFINPSAELRAYLSGEAKIDDIRKFPTSHLLLWLEKVNADQIFSSWKSNRKIKKLREILMQIAVTQTELDGLDKINKATDSKPYKKDDFNLYKRHAGPKAGKLEELEEAFLATAKEKDILYGQFVEKVTELESVPEILANAPAELRYLVWLTGKNGSENVMDFPDEALIHYLTNEFIGNTKAPRPKIKIDQGVVGLLRILQEISKLSVDLERKQSKINAFKKQAALVFTRNDEFRKLLFSSVQPHPEERHEVPAATV